MSKADNAIRQQIEEWIGDFAKESVFEPAFAGEPAQRRMYVGEWSDRAANRIEALLPEGYWLDMAHCPGEYCLCREASS